MTGLERNSDIVFAASYAPLLQVSYMSGLASDSLNLVQHVNSTQWVSPWHQPETLD